MNRTGLKQMVQKLVDFTVFSNSLIKELKKCGVELEYVQHVSHLFF